MSLIKNKTFRYFLYIMAGVLAWQLIALAVMSIVQQDFLMFLYDSIKAVIALIGSIVPSAIGALIITKREENDRS